MLCILSFFINAPVDKLLVGTLHERTTLTLVLGDNPHFPFFIVQVFIAFSTLHFAPEEDTHNRAHRGTILDVFEDGVDFSRSQGHDGYGIGQHDVASYKGIGHKIGIDIGVGVIRN